GNDQTECYGILDDFYQGATVQSEVSKGKITYDATAAEACLTGIVYGSCQSFWANGPTFPDSGNQALVGPPQNGRAARVDFDGAGNNVCGWSQTWVGA